MFELPFENMGFPLRRRFLQQAGLGFGSLALASMLQEESKAASISNDPLALKLPHFPAKVKSIIWLFMTGAPSQVDTWDYKPELQKRDGQQLAGADSKTGFFSTSGKCLKSPFEWKQHGQSGSWVSDIFSPAFPACGQDVLFALDVFEAEQSCSRIDRTHVWNESPGFAFHGSLVELWAWFDEPGPALIRGAA